MATARISFAAPKYRDPVTDSQIMLFCRLVDDLAQTSNSGSPPSPQSPEYERFMLGADACGFVCCDLTADPDLLVRAEKAGWVEKAKFKDLRHYLHSLIRAERQAQKHPSDKVTSLHTALRNGVLARVCSRLRTEQSWRGL